MIDSEAGETKKRAPPKENLTTKKTNKTSAQSHFEDYHLNNSANLQIKITGFVEGPAELEKESLAIDSTLEGSSNSIVI